MAVTPAKKATKIKATTAVAAKAPKEVAATGGAAKMANPVVRRKEFVERVVARSGLKPNAVKSVLDALLQEMGDALSNEETLNLQPFGKVMVNRKKDTPKAEILICKLRRNKGVAVKVEAAE